MGNNEGGLKSHAVSLWKLILPGTNEYKTTKTTTPFDFKIDTNPPVRLFGKVSDLKPLLRL